MNYIDQLRESYQKNLNPETLEQGDRNTFISPTGLFRVETVHLWAKEPSWDLTRVAIHAQDSTEKLFDFFVNDSSFWFGWVATHTTEYLICAEDIFGGQTVIDLTNRLMSSYSPGEDGFIWTDFHLSPDGKTLATIGCYWACPYVIKLFDFSNPLNLPLPEMREIQLLDNDEIILGWLDNETLKMRGVKREKESEYDPDGKSFRMRTISESNVERTIKINCSSS